MAKDRFLIGYADNNSGLQTNLRPWLLPDNAFARLENAYVFRGRVKKRFGSTLMGETQLNSRVRINIGTTAAVSGNFTATVPGSIFKEGQMFSIGSTIFTVYQTGTPAAMLSTGTATGTYDTTTGQVVITGNTENPATAVYFYPAEPIMGITQYEKLAVNNELTVAFDTQFSYYFDVTTNYWEQLGLATWSGNNTNYFWCTNYYGSTANINDLWVTNNKDAISYLNDTTWTSPLLTTATTTPATTNIVETARIILPFKNRLVLLNTKETVKNVTGVLYPNRCRYCGTDGPLAVDAWNVSVPGKGGFVDAATSESIVTAQILKDRLIVYFERSTWELVYTGNQIQPFVWQKINTELGAESTFSQVPFDKVVLGLGNSGIHACTGTNVDRIDNKIPDLVFSIHNQNQAVDRVAGIRDYETEMVYWTIPSNTRTSNNPYCDKVLVYNYMNNSWAINHDSFTTFGYYQLSDDTPGLTWGDADMTWGSASWAWGGIYSGLIGRRLAIVAGNQQGWIVIVRPDVSYNSASLQVTNNDGAYTYTVIDHNLKENDYVNFDGAGTALRVTEVVDKDTVKLGISYGAVYNGGLTLARVSKIDIRTKEYNFYVDKNRNMYLSQIAFLVDKITNGQITIDYYISSAYGFSMMAEGDITGTLIGSSTLELDAYALAPFEEMQERVWHSMYTQAEGECIQLRIYYSPDQMVNRAGLPFTLHALIFLCQPTTMQLQG